MTRFTGPLKVKKAFSETTVASIDVNGVIKSGSSGEQGFVQLVQQKDITPNTAKVTAAIIPGGSDILDAYFMVKTAFGTAASDVILRVSGAVASGASDTLSIVYVKKQ